MTQTRDLIKKMADFFKGEEFYEKGEDARLELSPDDVRCMYCISCALGKIRAEIEETYMNLTYEENHKVGGSWGLRKALEIIDKYIAESEVQDADHN